MERNEKVVSNNWKRMVWYNFVGGIAWGLGVTIGLSIILTLLSLIIGKLSLIPIVGNFVTEIVSFVLQRNPHLLK